MFVNAAMSQKLFLVRSIFLIRIDLLKTDSTIPQNTKTTNSNYNIAMQMAAEQ